MKAIATIGALALASAHQLAPEESFLTENAESLVKTQTVVKGRCQFSAGTQIFDVTKFDSMIRHDKLPSNREAYSRLFQFKLCQGDFDLKDDKNYMDQGTCTESSKDLDGNAYLSKKESQSSNADPQDYDCEYTFQAPKWTANRNRTNTEREQYSGYTLGFTSDQPCTYDKNQKFQYLITTSCNKDKTQSAWSSSQPINCMIQETYEGPEACSVIDLGDNTVIKAFKKFLGAFEIIAGIALCFFGSKFIFWTLRFLLFVLVNAVAWALTYNLHIINENSNPGVLIAFALATIIGGIVVAYYFGNFAEQYGVALLAGFAGGFIMFMLTANLELKSLYKQILIVLTAAASIYIGKTYNKFIKSFGTACIGSFFTMHGLGQYLGGFPNFVGVSQQLADSGIDVTDIDISDMKSHSFLLYILGMVVLTIVGTIVQLKYIAPDDEDEDDMMKKDYS